MRSLVALIIVLDPFLAGAGSNEHRDDLSADGIVCRAMNEQDENASRERRASEMSSLSENDGFDAVAKASVATSLSGSEGVTLSQMLNESLSTPHEMPAFAMQGVGFVKTRFMCDTLTLCSHRCQCRMQSDRRDSIRNE